MTIMFLRLVHQASALYIFLVLGLYTTCTQDNAWKSLDLAFPFHLSFYLSCLFAGD